MKFKYGYKAILSSLVLIFAFAGFACQQQQQSAQTAQSPTEAYKALYAAVKAKDGERIKRMMSKNSLAFAGFASQKQNQTIEKTLENGFLETTFAAALPEMRDERVKDNFGAVEVYNQKQKRWDDTAFVLEEGGWKLAVGDQFQGSYKSPGKGKAQIEAEASNPMNDMPKFPVANTNGGFPSSSPSANSAAANGKKEKVQTAEVPVENKNKKSVAEPERK